MPFDLTFNGLALFGDGINVVPSPNPNDRQVFAVAGLNGTFSKNLGSRGGRTMITGFHVGASPSDLFLLQQAIRNQMAGGVAAVFTDLNAVAWPATVIEAFYPTDPVEVTSWQGGVGWGQHYACVLYHHI